MEAALMTTSEDQSIILDPQLLEPKFLQAEQTLEQMIADSYIPGVDAITDQLVFTGKATTTIGDKFESFLTDVNTIWGSLLEGTLQESLMPSCIVVRNIFLAYSRIFDGYGENMRKLALKSAHPLNISIFTQIYQQSKERDSDQDLADSLKRAFFEPNGDPASIFTTNSIIIKNLCINTIDWMYKTTDEIKRKQELNQIILDTLPRLQSAIPEKHLIPNNKLANTITKDIIDAGMINLSVLGKGKNEIFTRNILTYEGPDIKLLSRRPFTEYDRAVSDSVTTLFVHGDQSHIITPAIVYREMIHATETETPSPQQIGAVTRSLDKIRFIRVQIDCTEELMKRGLSLNGEQITGGKIDTYLLALEKVSILAGGQKVTAYQIIRPPILYEYARLTGQIITVSPSLLDIRDKNGKRVYNTETRIPIKNYLLRRVSIMKGRTGSRQSKHILYDAIYDTIMDDKGLSRKDQQNIRDYTHTVLQCWKQDGFIRGFNVLTEGKSGRKKYGVEILL